MDGDEIVSSTSSMAGDYGDWCRPRLPSSAKYFQQMDSTTHWMILGAILCVALICGLYVWQAIYVDRRCVNDARRRILTSMLSLFPLIGVCCAISITIPSTIYLMRIFTPAFFGRTLLSFSALVNHLFGGQRRMARKMSRHNIKVNLARGPFICCKKCVPVLEPTHRNVRLMEILIWQAAILQSVLSFVQFVVFADGHEIKTMGTVTDVVRLISSMVAMAACFALVEIASKMINRRYGMWSILVILKLSLFIINIQGSVMGILASFGVIAGGKMLDAQANALIYNDILVCAEMLLMSAMTMWLFRPELADLTQSEETQLIEDTESRWREGEEERATDVTDDSQTAALIDE